MFYDVEFVIITNLQRKHDIHYMSVRPGGGTPALLLFMNFLPFPSLLSKEAVLSDILQRERIVCAVKITKPLEDNCDVRY